MFEYLEQLLSYGFVQRALVVGALVSLSAALLGVVLVLKNFSMIGDGLSHVSFGAMTVALALNVTPLYIAVPVMILAAFLLLRIRKNGRINADVAIALVSSSSIAVGVTAAALSGGMNTDVYSYMFGSVLAVSVSDVILAGFLCATVLTVFIFGYNRIFAETFDEEFARAGKTKSMFNLLFSLLTAAVVVVGMRVMGTMLISGLIIFPAVTGMRLARSFKGVLICAVAVSLVAFVSGMLFSVLVSSIPSGAAVVLTDLLLLLISLFIRGKKA